MNAGKGAATAVSQADKDAAQLSYARLLDWGTRIGMVVLLASFGLSVSGLLPSLVPPERMPELWHLPLERYLEASGAPTGWQWLGLLHHGDVLGLTGIAILAGCSGLCLLAMLPLYRAQRDRIYLGLCVAQILVLVLAASGWLSAGH